MVEQSELETIIEKKGVHRFSEIISWNWFKEATLAGILIGATVGYVRQPELFENIGKLYETISSNPKIIAAIAGITIGISTGVVVGLAKYSTMTTKLNKYLNNSKLAKYWDELPTHVTFRISKIEQSIKPIANMIKNYDTIGNEELQTLVTKNSLLHEDISKKRIFRFKRYLQTALLYATAEGIKAEIKDEEFNIEKTYHLWDKFNNLTNGKINDFLTVHNLANNFYRQILYEDFEKTSSMKEEFVNAFFSVYLDKIDLEINNKVAFKELVDLAKITNHSSILYIIAQKAISKTSNSKKRDTARRIGDAFDDMNYLRINSSIHPKKGDENKIKDFSMVYATYAEKSISFNELNKQLEIINIKYQN